MCLASVPGVVLARVAPLLYPPRQPRQPRQPRRPRRRRRLRCAALRSLAQASGKEGKHLDSMLKGRLQKFFADSCLLEQAFVLDEKQRVGALVKAAGARVLDSRLALAPIRSGGEARSGGRREEVGVQRSCRGRGVGAAERARGRKRGAEGQG